LDVVAALRQFHATGDATPLVASIPYLRFLGVRFGIVDGAVRGTLVYGDHLIGNPTLPALHGGTLGALMEATSIAQILWEADAALLPKTINLTVDYLRSGRPVDTFARGVITRHGRRVINVRAEAWQDDPTRPIATAVAHFLVKPLEAPGGEPVG
jgi:acyl-coenzyme A thioesterase PaaI-like protein